jgi:hypothetical protein
VGSDLSTAQPARSLSLPQVLTSPHHSAPFAFSDLHSYNAVHIDGS